MGVLIRAGVVCTRAPGCPEKSGVVYTKAPDLFGSSHMVGRGACCIVLIWKPPCVRFSTFAGPNTQAAPRVSGFRK